MCIYLCHFSRIWKKNFSCTHGICQSVWLTIEIWYFVFCFIFGPLRAMMPMQRLLVFLYFQPKCQEIGWILQVSLSFIKFFFAVFTPWVSVSLIGLLRIAWHLLLASYRESGSRASSTINIKLSGFLGWYLWTITCSWSSMKEYRDFMFLDVSCLWCNL